MQSSTYCRNHSYISLGERRGKSDLARFSLDLSWARAVSDSARSRAYPSPPMSGSPPLPPTRHPDSSDRGHGSYGSIGQDVFAGTQTPQSEHSEQGRVSTLPPYQQDPHPPSYASFRIEDLPPSQHQYAPHHRPQMPPQQLPYPPHPPQFPAPFSTPDRPPIGESSGYASPKAQRKTKGHVASACVPCKRAHLRCDAQRPCSRCLGNGKEDTCVDVIHKKRGRPRLRDERERYDSVGASYPAAPEATMRRPVSLYSPGEASINPSFDPIQRSGSYRVIKSHGGSQLPGSGPERFLDRAPPADASLYGGSMPPSTRMLSLQEAARAYLTMDMRVAKATQGFGDTVGVQSVVARKFHDTVVAGDLEKVIRLQRIFEEERREREPNYLPPIYPKYEEDRVIESVGFGPDEMSQFKMDRQETFTFQAPDGLQRTFQVRFGLAKKESTYFIALALHVPATPQTYQQPSSSPFSQESYSREPQYGYRTSQQPYPQNPSTSSFMSNPHYGEPRGEAKTYRTSGSGPPGLIMPQLTNVTSFIPMRPDYVQGQNPYQTPRSELPQVQPPRQHQLQLPPIRGQPGDGSSADSTRRRDDRSGRVDIGGLLEESDPSPRRN